jgi:hypothetical protein
MMTIEQVKQLHSGDRVFWDDPDCSICSRYYTIAEIVILNEQKEIVQIVGNEGDMVECLAKEIE